MTNTPSIRELAANHRNISFTDDTQRQDLLDPQFTHDNLVQALLTALDAEFKVQITSANRDHDNDSELGPHGHREGFALDVWCADLDNFIQHLCTHNKLVTKVGLGGAQAQALVGHFDPGDTIVFNDNSEPHIHFQTA